MLDQHTAKTLHGAEWRAMDHHRMSGGVIRTDIGNIEPLRKIVVDLNRTQLPFPTDHILDHEVDFRSVKGCFPRFFGKLDPQLLHARPQGRLRLIPLLESPDKLGRIRIAQPKAYPIGFHAQGSENFEDETQTALDFSENLLIRAENVRIILSESSHPGHPT